MPAVKLVAGKCLYTLPGGMYDRRPYEVDGFVKGRTSGFYFDTAGEIMVCNSSVTGGSNRPGYFAHVLESANTIKTTAVNLAGQSAFPREIKDIVQ